MHEFPLLNYIYGGCNINLFVCLDFSINGLESNHKLEHNTNEFIDAMRDTLGLLTCFDTRG